MTHIEHLKHTQQLSISETPWVPGDIFACLAISSAVCLPALSQHPVKAEPPHKNSQHDFIVFSLINLCKKPKAIPVPGSSSLAGNPNFVERSNMTVVMKTRQKQKTVNIFIATGAITIHRVYSELSAMPLLIWDPVKTKLQVKFLALTITSNFSFILSHGLTLITL